MRHSLLPTKGRHLSYILPIITYKIWLIQAKYRKNDNPCSLGMAPATSTPKCCNAGVMQQQLSARCPLLLSCLSAAMQGPCSSCPPAALTCRPQMRSC
jgi:hypothetical protein